MKKLKCEKGLATLESVAMLPVFLLLIAFTIGSFGIVHTAILNSIAARNYAFETFRHRANVTYFRDNRLTGQDADRSHYLNHQFRRHRIRSELSANSAKDFPATERPISIGIKLGDWQNRDETTHNERIRGTATLMQGARNQNMQVNPIWVTGQYGICINSSCGN